MKKSILILALLLIPMGAWAVTADEYYSAGFTLFQQKDYDKAVQYFHAAIQQNPDLWQAYQFLGESYYQMGNRTEAVVAIDQSLKLHSNNPELKRFLQKVKDTSPWVSVGSWKEELPILSILLSILTFAWTFFATRRSPRGSRDTPPKA